MTPTTLTPGSRLGPYEIVAPLGAGGMGEVYRARDTRLDRTVAIKVLPGDFAGDPQSRARFDREARAISQLTHPHICTLYDVGEESGTAFLVMELLQGQTLAERLKNRALSLDDALKIAIEIADALSVAHRQGIVHRDLKPANIMLTKSGAKLLDFGLAKAVAPAVAIGANSAHETASTHLTGQGSILGTLHYMAPEQVEGREADARSDIWALGAVIYEMVTGHLAFAGESSAAVVGAILKDRPLPLADGRPGVSAALEHLVAQCLEKDPDARWQAVGDVTRELEWVRSAPPATTAMSTRRREGPVAVASVLLTAVVVGFATWTLTRPAPPNAPPVVRSTIALPAALPLTTTLGVGGVGLAPDGSFLVYHSGDQGQLVVRWFDRMNAAPVPGVAGANQPVVSPDSRWIAYVERDVTLKKVAIGGGAPVTLARMPGNPSGTTWLDEGTIIVGMQGQGLLRVPAGGGAPTVVTTTDVTSGERSHLFPWVLPDARAVVFTVVGARPDDRQIALLDLRTGQRRTLFRGSDAKYVDSGHLVYAEGRALFAVRFDLATLAVIGEPVPVVEGISISPTGYANSAVTVNGTLVYAPDGVGGARLRSLVFVDRQGHETLIPAPPHEYAGPRLSPDGTRVAVGVEDEQQDIWVWDLARHAMTRLTFDPAREQAPAWTPDGRRIAFLSNRAGQYSPFVRPADGTGADASLTTSVNPIGMASVTPDGMFLIGHEIGANSGRNVVRIPMDAARGGLGTGPPAVEPLIETPANELNGEVSPDGHFLAYQSDESGRAEVYVRPYPDVKNGRWQVSTSGGSRPAWTRGGKELVYLDGASHLTSVSVETDGTFHAGTPVTLVTTVYGSPTIYRGYDVSSDGQRFLVVKDSPDTSRGSPEQGLILVQNWREELKRLLPAK